MNMHVEPQGSDPIGWLVVVIGTIATLWTIAASIYWVVRPGETNADHPKNLVLKDDR
ncbi:MAG: hypothetical protein ABI282_05660 [Candidatus Baltobacteraceae bacterium]